MQLELLMERRKRVWVLSGAFKEHCFVNSFSVDAGLCQMFIEAKRVHATTGVVHELDLDNIFFNILTASLSFLGIILTSKQMLWSLFIYYLREMWKLYFLSVFYPCFQNLTTLQIKQVSTRIFQRITFWTDELNAWRHAPALAKVSVSTRAKLSDFSCNFRVICHQMDRKQFNFRQRGM